MLPSVSVVTPSYNQAAFLQETLRSVIAQRSEVKEYFVLDGGSTDGSAEIVRRHQGDIDFWCSQKDGGQAAAIQDGFKRATGDVLCWINSDDVYLLGALRLAREAFASHPDWDVVSGWCVFIDKDSRVIRLSRPPVQTLRAARWGISRVAQPACFFRRRAYEEVGGLDKELACVMDTELWYRMLMCTRWGHARTELAGFRVHARSKGQSWLTQYAHEHAELGVRHPQFAAESMKHRLGRTAYRLWEMARGRYLGDAWATVKLKGTHVNQLNAEVLALNER